MFSLLTSWLSLPASIWNAADSSAHTVYLGMIAFVEARVASGCFSQSVILPMSTLPTTLIFDGDCRTAIDFFYVRDAEIGYDFDKHEENGCEKHGENGFSVFVGQHGVLS